MKNSKKTISDESKNITKVIVSSAKSSKYDFKKWNLRLALLHFVQALIVLRLAASGKGSFDLTTNHLSIDELSNNLVTVTKRIGSINLVYVVAAFFLTSALFHLIIGTLYYKKYISDLSRGLNKMRWIEYSISASIMMVGIGLLSGIQDVSTLIMIFALDAIMNLMGLVMELYWDKTRNSKWLAYIIGCFAGIVPWIVFVIYVLGAREWSKNGVPGFVYWIYLSIFVFFNCFALNMYLQYKKKGKWADYLYGERAYMILSLVAKSALAWQIYAGALRP